MYATVTICVAQEKKKKKSGKLIFNQTYLYTYSMM